MKLYRYELFYWGDGKFIKEELEAIEKPKTYLDREKKAEVVEIRSGDC
ncbi:hypothetical protein [Streptococcus azizii]|nr:hypothetical protein [Streptococcus azizii]